MLAVWQYHNTYYGAFMRNLFIIVYLFAALSLAASPQITSTTYQVKQGSLLGWDITLAEFKIDFDQDLYRYEGLRCPTVPQGPLLCNTASNNTLNLCSPCDYSKNDSSCGTRTINNGSCTTCSNTDTYCNSSVVQNWATLQPNTTRSDFVSQGNFVYYRFQLNNPCQTIILQVTAKSGDPDLYISTTGPIDGNHLEDNPNIFGSQKFGGELLLLCPTDSNYAVGTYYLAVFGYYATEFDISLTLIPFNPAIISNSSSASTSTCTNLAADVTCLEESVEYSVTSTMGELYYFSFQLNGSNCTQMSFVVRSLSGDADFYVSDYQLRPDADTFIWASRNSGIEDSLFFSYCPTSNITTFGITVEAFVEGNFTIFVDTLNRVPFKLQVSSQATYQASFTLMNSANIFCGENIYDSSGFVVSDFIANSDAKYSCSSWFDCLNLYAVYPQQDSRSLWPLPPVFSKQRNFVQLDDYQSSLSDNLTVPVTNRLTLILLLGFESPQGGGLTFLDPEELGNCTIQLLGTFGNAQGEGVVGNTPRPQEITATCNYTNFRNVKDQIDTLLERSETTVNQDQLNNLNFDIDTLTITDAWLGCTYLMDSFLEISESEVTVQDSLQCFETDTEADAWLEDPCCNSDLGFYECCEARNVTITSTLSEGINKDAISQTCSSQKCSENFVNEYQLKSVYINDVNYGCASILSRQTSYEQSQQEAISFYYDCYYSVFGEDNFGIECSSDDDCPDWSGHCDVFSHRCLATLDVAEDTFLNCTIYNMNTEVELYLRSLWDLPTDKYSSEYLTELKTVLLADDCNSQYSLAWPKRYHFEYRSFDVTCSDLCDTPSCPGKSCQLPVQCTQSWAEPCERLWTVLQSSEHECLSEGWCNWMPDCVDVHGDGCESQCLNGALPSNFCALCEGDTCKEVSSIGSENSCLTTTACVLSNGTVIPNLTPAQCTNIGVCTDPAYSGDKSQCESRGQCSDDIFDNTLLGISAACLFPPVMDTSEGVNLMSCDDTLGDILTVVGCINYTVSNQLSCENLGGTWMNKASTELECNAHGTGCLEDRYYWATLTPKNSTDCEECGGQVQNYFEWTPETFYSGILRNLSWIQGREYTSRYQWSPTISLTKLHDAILDAAGQTYSYSLATQLLCKYNSILNSLESVSCDCTVSENGDCFPGREDVQIGVGRFCPGSASEINAPPSRLSISADAVDPQLPYCITVIIDIELASQYRTEEKIVLSTGIVSGKNINDDNPYASVVNKKGATVGQLIGDGIQITFGNKSSLEEFEVCLSSRSDIEVDKKQFSIYDFGVLKSNEIQPLGVDIQVSESTVTYYCTTIKTSTLQSSKDTVTASLFPILRIDNFEEQTIVSFTSGEQGAIYFCAVLYLLMFLICVGEIAAVTIYPIHNVGFFPKRVLIAILMMENLVRAIYFFILPSGALSPDDLADFFLSELPTFFYCSAFSVMIFMWAVVVETRITKHENESTVTRIKLACFAINALIYLILALLLILFRTFPDDTSQSTTVCGVPTKESVPAEKTSRWVISIVYRTFICVIALGIEIFFAYFGWNLLRKIRSMLRQVKSYERRITIVTAGGGISFLLYTVLLVVSAGTSFSQFYAQIFILTALELIPQGMILFVYGYRPWAVKPEDAKTTKSTIASGIALPDPNREEPDASDMVQLPPMGARNQFYTQDQDEIHA